jgi:hypothetical protein
MNYWQVAAGSDGRDYTKDFLRFGMAFVGGKKHVERMNEVQVGDRVILKQGTTAIAAVGTVVQRAGTHGGCGDKQWLRDYDGWDLEAYCYVDWHRPPQPMPVAGLARGTIKSVTASTVTSAASAILTKHRPQTHLDPEPGPTAPVADETILDFLISNGLGVRAAEELTQTFGRIRRLAKFYYHHCDWETIREHETRTFLIVPLLLALGWVEQQIKIELSIPKGRVDVALFQGVYPGKESETRGCVSLIESKGFSQGLLYAPGQAHNYASHFPNCKVVFVSNGYCYKAYLRKEDGTFDPDRPSAYLNILNPRDHYPLDPTVPGCIKAIELLLNWV